MIKMRKTLLILIFPLAACSFKQEIACDRQPKSFPLSEITNQFYSLPESNDPSHIAAVLSDFSNNCKVPEDAEDKLMAAIEKVGKLGDRDLLVDLYASLQSLGQKYRATLITASGNFREDKVGYIINGKYKLVDLTDVGQPFSKSPGELKTPKVMGVINADLQDEDIRLVKTNKLNKLVVVQREEFQGASGGNDSLSFISLDNNELIKKDESDYQKVSESIEFSAWGTAGDRIGRVVVDEKGNLIGVVSASREDVMPTTKASNAAIGCQVRSEFYRVGTQGWMAPIIKHFSCDSSEKIFIGQDQGLETIFGWIAQSREKIGVAKLINYSRMDNADKMLLRYMAANNDHAAEELYEDLRNRFPGGRKEISLEQLKEFVQQLNQWAQGVLHVKEALNTPKDDSTNSILSAIGKLKDDVDSVPDFQKIDEDLNKYHGYSLLVYRQIADSITLNGKTYRYVYEALISGMYPVTKGLRLVVGDSPVFSGQGYLSVSGIEIGTTSYRLNENLGGFVVDVPVIAASSKEDEQRISKLRKERDSVGGFVKQLNSTYVLAEQLNSRLEGRRSQ